MKRAIIMQVYNENIEMTGNEIIWFAMEGLPVSSCKKISIIPGYASATYFCR